MVVIAVPDTFLHTIDPVTATETMVFQLTTNTSLSTPLYHDGRFLWISRIGGPSTLTPFDLTTNTRSTSVSITVDPVGIWSDKRFMWAITSAGTLDQYDLETGTATGIMSIITGTATGLTGDRRFLWTINLTSGNIEQYDPETGTLIGGFTHPSDAKDLHHDGRFIWVLTGGPSTTGTIKQFDPETGTQIGSFTTRSYTLSGDTYGLCGDGRYLYYTDSFI